MIPETKQGPNVITRCKQGSMMARVLKWPYNNTFYFVLLSFEVVELGIRFQACMGRLLKSLEVSAHQEKVGLNHIRTTNGNEPTAEERPCNCSYYCFYIIHPLYCLYCAEWISIAVWILSFLYGPQRSLSVQHSSQYLSHSEAQLATHFNNTPSAKIC